MANNGGKNTYLLNDLDSDSSVEDEDTEGDPNEAVHLFQTASTAHDLPLYSPCDQPNSKSAAHKTRCPPASATLADQANTDPPTHQIPPPSLPPPKQPRQAIPIPPFGFPRQQDHRPNIETATGAIDLERENAQLLKKANCTKCKERIRRAACFNTLQDGQNCGDISFCELCYKETITCPKCKKRMDKVILVIHNKA
ncbi:hypothetical protein DPMN_042890 [Dreissena polymorpha]|uniref:RING-type domain-containing protein n=1 Tax=Dreissena polymorpha TaxID=45954 RepID=A0A9D4HXD9_DREPO|nr:hypothetical protein DPMN_042890 [Dreissena polymorpha]